ncbi:uncharacterized protein PSANT_01600 [Moesziomyces antarcticus]|uniref:PHD-type domain-containing protein n=1 Tax=Pseudozyma antarctica TaxID=84753 RepID=A0A5C3FJF5_PSEA2|nr:uncharacterized protein PSANT_01600 [Moesziomyces antarcticus]
MSPVPSPRDTLGRTSPDQARSGEAGDKSTTKSSAQPTIPRESTENGNHPRLQQGVLADSPSTPMTPTRLVSTTAPPIPHNWLELALKGRAAALREAQRKSAPSSLPADMQQAPVTDPPTAGTSMQTDAVQDAATQQSSGVKTEPDVDMEATAATLTAPPTEGFLHDGALAGGLVSASSSPPPAPSTNSPEISVAAVQPPPMAALALASQNAPAASGPEALRTEIMGPPPSLPTDPAYPPLNPVATEIIAPPTASKRRGPAPAANGAARRSDPIQAPADFDTPTNLNGKMPYALFQTVQKSAIPASKSAQTTLAAQRESTADDAAAAGQQSSGKAESAPLTDNKAIDPLIADVLTDADSVATATATRETSREASAVPETGAQGAATEIGEPAQPSTAIGSETASIAPSSSVPQQAAPPTLSAGTLESADASPSAALRRTPSNRGASLQASQSITSAYADPMGLKKHRELLAQEAARARRSPSAASAGAASVAPAVPSAGASKKSNTAARTIVPPSLVEPPPGMMHTPEGRLRVIPGIAGAVVPTASSSSSTDAKLAPRLEDKGSANNDFCEVCLGHGRFVCCDGCPRSFHFFCMNPPLDIDEMPPSNAAQVLGPAKANPVQKGKAKAGEPGAGSDLNMDEMWFCNVCVAERKPKAVSRPKGLGPFGYLLPILSQQNPKSFQLPADVRTYFKDVATAKDGDFVNAAMVRQVKPNRHGQIEPRDPYRLKDKNGDAVLCYRCGGTALPAGSDQHTAPVGSPERHSRAASEAGSASAATPADHTIREGTGWRRIVSCDFCSLHWHIDCVDPPMLGMPSNLRKWMCPAHSDHVGERRRVARIGAAVPKTLDLPLPSVETIGPGKHFRTRVLNNGDIDIIPDPMELLMGANGITGSLQTGIKEVPLVPIPGVVDSPTLTDGGSKLASKIRYRFPEKVIRTDFWSKLRGDDASKIGSVFYLAADELVHRSPFRLVAAEDGAAPTGEDVSRYRPFGRRDYQRSGLDSLADIASARLAGDALAVKETPGLIRPSRTRQLVATALGIDLDNSDVPESSLRSSLDEPESLESSDSPLSSLSDSESDAGAETAAQNAAQREMATPVKPAQVSQPAQTVQPVHPVQPVQPGLSEEELIKRIAMEAASGVSSGDPVRLSKRKAAVAAESAMAGSPNTPAKKLRSASPAVSATPTPIRTGAAAGAVPAAVQVGSPAAPATGVKKIILKSNGVARSGKTEPKGVSEAQAALRTAHHLAGQYADERREIEQLRAIRELMRLKGPDRMLEFLLSPNEPAGATKPPPSEAVQATSDAC